MRRGVPASGAARALGLELDAFRARLPELVRRGFPEADPTTDLFDPVAIDRWKDLAWAEREDPKRVYVVGYGAYVKIGYSERPVWERIAALQTGSPEKIQVYGIINGTKETERQLHTRFAAYRLEGEWFRLSDEIRDWIKGRCEP